MAMPPKPQFDVATESVSDSDATLLVLCLPSGSSQKSLTGMAAEADKALGGLLTKARNSGHFLGLSGETLVMLSPPGTLRARKLLLLGLGSDNTMTPTTLRQIGRAIYREGGRVGAYEPAVVLPDVTKLSPESVARQITTGVMEGYKADVWLFGKHADAGRKLDHVTYLVAPTAKAETESGIDKVLASAH